MEKKTFKQRIKEKPSLKQAVYRLIMHPVKTRPNWWIRLFDFIYLKRGKGSVIYRSVRKDLPPFNHFFLGKYSVVEDFSCLNNAVGDLTIGDYTRVGLRNTIIGPVNIGNHVNLAQNVTVTGLNHNYQDVKKMIDEQGVNTQPVVIEDDVWVGANSVILPGVTLGKHCVVAAGSVVSHSVPSYSICAGCPAKVIKTYDFETKEMKTWSDVGSTVAVVRAVAKAKGVDVASLDGRDIFDHYHEDSDYEKAVDKYYYVLANGIYNLQYAYDPQKIIIGGGISVRDDLLDEVNQRLDVIFHRFKHAKIRPVVLTCQYHNDANLLGALYHFLTIHS